MKLWLCSLSAAVLLFGCVRSTLPPTPMPNLSRTRLVVQKQFRIAAFDFGVSRELRVRERGSGPGPASGMEIVHAVPAALVTELRKQGRFAVYEGGNIRSDAHETLHEGTAKDFVDAYLSGTITGIGPRQACTDVRLANAYNHEVLYANEVCIDLTERGALISLRRDSIVRIAQDISRSIKRVGNAKVTSVDSELVVFDKGEKSGLVRGMVGYVVSTGESEPKPKVHEMVAKYAGEATPFMGGPIIVGELYVVSVEKDYSIGYLYRGDYALPRDTVFFK